ncbi:MAG: thioredoxin family protein [Patescibacteria group bacterium]
MMEKKSNLNILLFSAVAIIIAVSLVVGLVISLVANLSLNQKMPASANKPTKVDIVLLKESSCSDCFDLTPVIENIKSENVKINSEKTIEISTQEGKDLLSKYGITQIPSLLLSGNMDNNAGLKSLLSKWGEIKDGTFVLRQIGAPYFEVNSGKIRGKIQLTMLTDTSCNECYDVTKHEEILKQFGFADKEAKVVSVQLSDGQELVDKYNIKLVPTIILSGDLDAYSSLVKVWSQVGTVETDGVYVFREGVKQMGIYEDLSTGKIITPKPVTTPNQP